MIEREFVKGGAYFAIPATPGVKKRVMLCVGRDGLSISFARLGEGMYRQSVAGRCGGEFLQLKMGGEMYTVSVASVADMRMAGDVMEALG